MHNEQQLKPLRSYYNELQEWKRNLGHSCRSPSLSCQLAVLFQLFSCMQHAWLQDLQNSTACLRDSTSTLSVLVVTGRPLLEVQSCILDQAWLPHPCNLLLQQSSSHGYVHRTFAVVCNSLPCTATAMNDVGLETEMCSPETTSKSKKKEDLSRYH